MADYPLERHPQLLFGYPDDHRLTQIRGLLTRRISGQPFAVLLLDEFQKAHSKVHDRCLQLIDEGAFINGAGETLSGRSMIIFMTSNTGRSVDSKSGKHGVGLEPPAGAYKVGPLIAL